MLCRTTRIGELSAAYHVCYRSIYRRYCTTQENQYMIQKKTIHPYLQIHPWKSETEFANSLLKNIIYNAGEKLLYYLKLIEPDIAVSCNKRLVVVIFIVIQFITLCYIGFSFLGKSSICFTY